MIALLDETLKRTLKLPEVFICANDFIAIDLICALRRQGVRVPEDIFITGFDNSAESRIIEPHLTTIDIPSSKMGYIAADLLLSRIREPETPYRIMYQISRIRNNLAKKAAALNCGSLF